MTTEKNDLYFPSRNATESERLDWQHRLTIEAFSYVVHPKIQGQLPSTVRVADIGTGTGAWLSHAAKELPASAQFVGYDISPLQFPSSPASNMSFAEADIKKGFAPDVYGTFDLVHIRFMVFALRPSDWAEALSNVLKLLKPGGAIQWTESRFDTMTVLRNSGEYHSYPTLVNIWDKFMAMVGNQSLEGQKKLCELFLESDLKGVEFDKVSTERESSQRSSWALMLVPGLTDWAVKALGLSTEESKSLQEGIFQDVKNGAYLRQDLFTVIGWKP